MIVLLMPMLFVYMFSSKSSSSCVFILDMGFSPLPYVGLWPFLLLSHIADWVVAFNKKKLIISVAYNNMHIFVENSSLLEVDESFRWWKSQWFYLFLSLGVFEWWENLLVLKRKKKIERDGWSTFRKWKDSRTTLVFFILIHETTCWSWTHDLTIPLLWEE